MKKIVVCMPLDENLQNRIFEALRKVEWPQEHQVEFLHIFKEESFPYMLEPTIYPNQDQKIEIRNTIEELFEKLTRDLPFKNMSFHCGFSESPKEEMISYLSKNEINLAVVLTKEKHGLSGFFSSSFTDYLIAHAPCNILSIR